MKMKHKSKIKTKKKFRIFWVLFLIFIFSKENHLLEKIILKI